MSIVDAAAVALGGGAPRISQPAAIPASMCPMGLGILGEIAQTLKQSLPAAARSALRFVATAQPWGRKSQYLQLAVMRRFIWDAVRVFA
jgi:hypothetical protein